ncbi:MAG: hypothetical protein ACLP7O_03890 [Terracidiphilus sp.]
MNDFVKTLADALDVILFLDDLETLLAAASIPGSPKAVEVLKPALLRGEIQCIGACSPSDYVALTQAIPWLGDCFRAVHVCPMDEDSTLRVLQARKHRYEKFHGVTYTDEALDCAALNSGRYLPESQLLGKALELLDAAGARVKLRQASPPEEVTEVQKRIKFIVHRMDSAIANHEFVKAKFFRKRSARKGRTSVRSGKSTNLMILHPA